MKLFNNSFKKNSMGLLPLLAVLFFVSSCSTTQSASRENDGIYYDPSKEVKVIEKVVVVEDRPYEVEEVYEYETKKQTKQSAPVRIGGKYFDDAGNAPQDDPYYEDEYEEVYEDEQVVVNNYNIYTDGNDHVAWGDYAGVTVNVNTWGGSPWLGWGYRPWGYGWNRWNTGFGWNSWAWGGYYGWNHFAYNPWWGGGFYGPIGYYGPGYYGPVGFYGYPYYGGWGHPYYGGGYYGNPYYGNPYWRANGVRRGKGMQGGVASTVDSGVGSGVMVAANSARRNENSSTVRNGRDGVRTSRSATRASSSVRNSNTRASRSVGVDRVRRDRPVRSNNSISRDNTPVRSSEVQRSRTRTRTRTVSPRSNSSRSEVRTTAPSRSSRSSSVRSNRSSSRTRSSGVSSSSSTRSSSSISRGSSMGSSRGTSSGSSRGSRR